MADDDFTEAPGAGHNFLNQGAQEKLRAAVTRIERLNETIGEFNDDKAEEFKELKAAGFDVAVVKQVIQRRKKQRTEVEEKDSILDLYEGALGVLE
jgi:uncharacterized protein (UPF0335 family)